MDSSPITAWAHTAAYFTFANHETVVVGILIVSIAITLGVIGSIMRHEKRSEASLLSTESE